MYLIPGMGKYFKSVNNSIECGLLNSQKIGDDEDVVWGRDVISKSGRDGVSLLKFQKEREGVITFN